MPIHPGVAFPVLERISVKSDDNKHRALDWTVIKTHSRLKTHLHSQTHTSTNGTLGGPRIKKMWGTHLPTLAVANPCLSLLELNLQEECFVNRYAK